MNRWNWDRWAPFTGVLFAIGFAVAFLLFGDGPGTGDPASSIISFFDDHRGRVLTSIVIYGIAAIFFVAFVGAIATQLREAREGQLAATVIAAGAATAGVAIVIGALNASLAFSVAAQGDEGVVRGLNELTWVCETMVSFPVAALVAAASVGFLRTRLAPDWLGWGGVVAAVVMMLGGTVWAKDGFWSPDGAFAIITVIVFLVWSLVTGAVLTWWPRQAEIAQPATTPA